MMEYLDCWTAVAKALLPQALAGGPEFRETGPAPLGENSFGLQFTLAGEEKGRFFVFLDAGVFQAPLLGEGADQKGGWIELLREVANAAAGDMLPKAGKKCHIESCVEISGGCEISRVFQLASGAGTWSLAVRDETRATAPAEKGPPFPSSQPTESVGARDQSPKGEGLDLLLDVELDVALRFGCREMPLSEILELGAGDVVELDRHVTDPVDLIVGDRIVAQGEVVLVNGNFGLRVTQVATPRKRLESIRCLF